MLIHEVMKTIKGTDFFLFSFLRPRLYFLTLHLLDSKDYKLNERT